MKGKISNNVIGVFKRDKKYGKRKFLFEYFKKEISSSVFKINIKDINIIEIEINFLTNFIARYF